MIRRASAALAVLATVLLGTVATPGTAQADQVRNDQWQLQSLNADAAWRYSTGDGVVVAVVDSGVDAEHPDLAGQVLPGVDLVDGSTDGRVDVVGHGTTVAALIAGRGDDSSGVVGLAPKARILPVRVLDRDNKYDDATVVARGVRWAVDHGARVVNMSLGGTMRSPELADAVRYAAEHDVVVVACTGNTGLPGGDGVWYPAREPGVVAVTGLMSAADGPDAFWRGALTGAQTVLAAPASDLAGAHPGSPAYWRVQGTSFAAPLVSASAALVRARWPYLSANNVVNRLIRTARDLGVVGRDSVYGFGEVDPVHALTAQVPDVTGNPLVTATAPRVAGHPGGPGPNGPVAGATVPGAPSVPGGPLLGSAGVRGLLNRRYPDAIGFLLGMAGTGAAVLLVGVAGLVWGRRRDRLSGGPRT